jgi:hypothetical protein
LRAEISGALHHYSSAAFTVLYAKKCTISSVIDLDEPLSGYNYSNPLGSKVLYCIDLAGHALLRIE